MPKSSQFPESVQPGIPELLKPPYGWSAVPFGEVLRIVERPVELEDANEYQLVTAKRNRGGIVARERLTGKNILTKTQFLTHAGDFLISRRQIVHGACGLVPTHLDGSVVSNEYSTLLPADHLNPDFLAYYIHSRHFQETCFNASVGVDVEKMVFKIQEWLERHEMLLPPLFEQQKIADVLSSIDTAIQSEAMLLEQITRTKRAMLARLVKPEGDWTTALLGELFSERKEQGEATLPLMSVTMSLGVVPRSTSERRMTSKLQASQHLLARRGDLCYNTMRMWQGASGIAPCDCIISPAFVVCRPEPSIDPDFAGYFFKAPATIELLRRHSQGITGDRLRLYYQHFEKIRVVIPPLHEQKRFAAALTALDTASDFSSRYEAQLQTLKSGVLNSLLSGRVRVKLP